MELLFPWLLHYGDAALFGLLVLGIVGLPVPDETLLVFSGYLIGRGRLQPALTFAAAFGGSVCGISLSYWIGRTLGQQAVRRYGRYVHLTPERLQRVHAWFERIGEWLLAVGYFVPGVRHFTALVAGASELEYGTFALFAYSGAAIWVGTFLWLGYAVGEHWNTTMQVVHRYTAGTILIVLTLVTLGWCLRIGRQSR